LKEIQDDYPADEYSLDMLAHKYLSFLKDDSTEKESLAMLVRSAVEL